MTSEFDAMPYDAEVLRTLVDEGRITVKRIAMLTERDGSTVYRYLQGERTIPIGAWCRLFEELLDVRILRLLTGRTAICVHVLGADAAKLVASAGAGVGPVSDRSPARIPPFAQTLAPMADAIRRLAECCQYFDRIMGDGRIDQDDRTAIEKLIGLGGEAQKQIALCVASAETERLRLAEAAAK